MTPPTTRLSIDMDRKDHRKLKILADANGVSLKDFIVLDPYLHPQKDPHKATQKATENVEKGKNLKTFKSAEHMWKELGLDE